MRMTGHKETMRACIEFPAARNAAIVPQRMSFISEFEAFSVTNVNVIYMLNAL